MHIHLPSDVEELVRRKVEAGEYETPSDLVIEAIHLLDAQDRVRQQQLDDLRREIALGLDECERGEVAELDIDEIIGEARRQLAAKRSYSTAK
jgi:antitoxin ParD1/3/4